MSSSLPASVPVGLSNVTSSTNAVSRFAPAQDKGRHAANEFESILLTQWLQGAENSFGTVPGAEDEQDAGDEQMKSFAVQALAKGICSTGGLGLAKIVTNALNASQKTSDEVGHAK